MAKTVDYEQAPDLCPRLRIVSRAPPPKAAEIQLQEPGTWFDRFARTGAREISHRSPQVLGLGAFLFA